MADKYESKYTGEQIDAYLDDVATLKEQQADNEEALDEAITAHNVDDTSHNDIRVKLGELDTVNAAISSLTGRVTTIENNSYVTTSQFNDALGAYITKIDALIGGDT